MAKKVNRKPKKVGKYKVPSAKKPYRVGSILTYGGILLVFGVLLITHPQMINAKNIIMLLVLLGFFVYGIIRFFTANSPVPSELFEAMLKDVKEDDDFDYDYYMNKSETELYGADEDETEDDDLDEEDNIEDDIEGDE